MATEIDSFATVEMDGRSSFRTPTSTSWPYAGLAGAFLACLAASARRASGRDIPLSDVVRIGLASYAIGRIVARDRIMVFLRASFTSGEAAQQPRGDGFMRVLGELVTCPHCLALWISAGLSTTHDRFPRQTRMVTTIFAAHVVADVPRIIGNRFFPR
jgi:hypothetical protein